MTQCSASATYMGRGRTIADLCNSAPWLGELTTSVLLAANRVERCQRCLLTCLPT